MFRSAAVSTPAWRELGCFSEDLFSLEWIREARKVLVVLETEKVLQQADDRDRGVFFRILLDAPAEHEREWLTRANRKGELEIILQCDQEYVQRIEQLLAGAKTGQNAQAGSRFQNYRPDIPRS